MRVVSIFILVMFSAVLFVGCEEVEPSKKDSKTEGASDESSAIDTIKAYAEALATNDVDAAIEFYDADTFKIEGFSEAEVKELTRAQLRTQDVPLFAKDELEIKEEIHFVQVEYKIGDKTRQLLLKKTDDGWKITSSLIES